MRNQRKIFSQIYDQYIDKIYRFIFFKVNSQEIAEDLASETFLRCWEVFKKRNNIDNPQAFLYQIARNLIVDHYREKGKAKIVSAEYVSITDPESDLEEKFAATSDLETIKTALVNLRDEYQEVVIWHYIDDLSIPEIAEILNKSEGAVRVMLSRALKCLREAIENRQKTENETS